jgi:hypothetical protein
MKWTGSGSTPTDVQLSGVDGVVHPDASGLITVKAEYVNALIRGGWSIVVSGITAGAGSTSWP